MSNYYAFGWEIEPLSWSIETFKFGFNGKEKDGDITGGALDFGARIYSAKIGRWLSRDPLEGMFPHFSPYMAFNDNPVYYIDPFGMSSVNSNGDPDKRRGKAREGSKGSGDYYTLPEILVEADALSIGGLVKKGLDNFVSNFKDVFFGGVAFGIGTVDAYLSDNFLGLIPRHDASWAGEYGGAFELGHAVGDIVAMIQGVAEVYQGFTDIGGGVVVTVLSDGTLVVVGGEMAAKGVGEIAHGAGVITVAWDKLLENGLWNHHYDNMSGHNKNTGKGSGNNPPPGKKPTPGTHKDDFIKLPGDQGYVHKKTGEIYKKSYTSHGNKGNTGLQWKVWPKGTKDFRPNSKKAKIRRTLDEEGNIIGY